MKRTVSAGGAPAQPAAASAWLRCRERRQDARCRVVVFPHAGGTANGYWAWAGHFPAEFEVWLVAYPGRETRGGEPLVDSMDRLADGVAAAIGEQAAGWQASAAVAGRAAAPLVLFGHSMGGAVAYETARRLLSRQPGLVRRLVVSARPAPAAIRPSAVHTYGRQRFLDALRSLGGTDAAVFEHQELVDYLLPIVRNDYRLIETYRPPADPRLALDILAFAAAHDPSAPVEDVLAWADVTTTRFDYAVFPGGHFYLRDSPAPVVAELVRRLRPLVDAPPDTTARERRDP